MELAAEDSTYEDIATKFREHFLYIARAMIDRGDGALSPRKAAPIDPRHCLEGSSD
ncbi:MAG TPA: hypothetical protein VEL51_17460 [Vicinamibacterales bacterium]|nr:hypothetical protein [Vicinamibacterales bacterium]